ncbi:MAG: OmpA family protein [Flavobacteriaceae bacterium]|nr:OmpA family protein [Flavobacteriaceae bacterium]
MKKLLAFIIFLLFLLLIWFSWNWYKETVVCCEESEEIVEVAYGPLIFDCSSEKVITNDLWPSKKKEILSLQKEGETLLIVAPYFDGEDESKALVRAAEIRILFKTELTDDQITFDSRKGGECENAKINIMHESRFKWVTRNGFIEEYFDHTKIHYKYDSTDEVKEANITAYFDKLASLLIETGDTVILTGHTDSDGTTEYNMQLGLDRANEFKSHLISRAVLEDQIKVETKGKSMPIATNATHKGKQDNRRVEIRIKK